jgi:hypothetical protein
MSVAVRPPYGGSALGAIPAGIVGFLISRLWPGLVSGHIPVSGRWYLQSALRLWFGWVKRYAWPVFAHLMCNPCLICDGSEGLPALELGEEARPAIGERNASRPPLPRRRETGRQPWSAGRAAGITTLESDGGYFVSYSLAVAEGLPREPKWIRFRLSRTGRQERQAGHLLDCATLTARQSGIM